MRNTARENGRIILAHGEVTGHCHEVVTAAGYAPDVSQAEYFDDPDTGQRTLMLLAPCELRHQEHGSVALDPARPEQVRQGDVLLQPVGRGTWRVIRQQEREADGWRQVAD